MEQVAAKVKSLIHENSHNVYNLSDQMTQLKVIQGAVARLLERIDDITHKGWHENRGTAHLSILEIQDTVRLINMAFYPLFKEMSEDIRNLNIHAEKLYETVIKNEEK